MNLQKLSGCIEKIKKDMGEALMGTSIVAIADGQAIAEHNSSPVAAAMHVQLTDLIVDMLSKGPYPALGKYYILSLEGNKMVLVIPLGEYQWGIVVDGDKIKLGLLLNVIVPELVQSFENALND